MDFDNIAFHNLTPDTLNDSDLNQACLIAAERADLIGSCLDPEFVRGLLQGNRQQKCDGLWQIHGVARQKLKAKARERELAVAERMKPQHTERSNPNHKRARDRRKAAGGALGRHSSAREAKNRSKKKSKAA